MLNQNIKATPRRDFNRRGFQLFAALLTLRAAGYSADALAPSLSDLTNSEASSGLKTALARGAAAAMNCAAEQAVPMAKTLLVKTVQAISVTDAKNILSGGEGAATRFFAEKTRSPLGVQFLPLVIKATES